jgi:two-component system chemotaxis sensor kinase CheA
MSIDFEMAEILKVFFEESSEGISAMESGLLSLEAGSDREQINTIFRAAHSIKGGAGTFGFMEISEFTHSAETLLDQMRNGGRAVSPEVVQVLLQSVDVMRDMLSRAQSGQPIANEHAQAVTTQLARILASAPPVSAGPAPAAPAPPLMAAAKIMAPSSDTAHWRIGFHPHPTLFETCNDPLRIFGQLAPLGKVTLAAHIAAIPPLADLDPTQCHLAWTITVEGAVTKPQIAEVFDWVDANSTITYELIDPRVGMVAAAILAPSADVPASPAGSTSPIGSASPPATATAAAPPAGPAPSPRAPGTAETPTNSARQSAESSSIRVATGKVDALINLVGELVITQSMLGRFSEDFGSLDVESLRRCLGHLARNTRELQESVLKIRMLPISFSFNRFPRLVHELSRKLGKRVDLRLCGESTEIDKTVLEKIADPLVHLVRNSLDHGLECPEGARARTRRHGRDPDRRADLQPDFPPRILHRRRGERCVRSRRRNGRGQAEHPGSGRSRADFQHPRPRQHDPHSPASDPGHSRGADAAGGAGDLCGSTDLDDRDRASQARAHPDRWCTQRIVQASRGIPSGHPPARAFRDRAR